MSTRPLYLKTTIALAVAAALSLATVIGLDIWAGAQHSTHAPLYGAFGWVAFGCGVAALATLVVGYGRMVLRALARQPGPTAPAAAPAAAIPPQRRRPSPHPVHGRAPVTATDLAAECDDTPTVAVVTRAPRDFAAMPRVYRSTPEPQMIPLEDALRLYGTVRDIHFDQGFAAAAGVDVPPGGEDAGRINGHDLN